MSCYMTVGLACDANDTSVRKAILNSLNTHNFEWQLGNTWWNRMDDQMWVLDTDESIQDEWEFADEFKKVSAEFPDIHFEIYVTNYDSDDMILHFMHGKMQVCHAITTFEPFDSELLK